MDDTQNSAAEMLAQMQRAAAALTGMLARTVEQASRQQTRQLSQTTSFESAEELADCCGTRTMKELTAILKDISAVAHGLDGGETQNGETGVILLPAAELPGPADEDADGAGPEAAGAGKAGPKRSAAGRSGAARSGSGGKP